MRKARRDDRLCAMKMRELSACEGSLRSAQAGAANGGGLGTPTPGDVAVITTQIVMMPQCDALALTPTLRPCTDCSQISGRNASWA